MQPLVAIAAVAPVLAEPSVRAEQVTQLVLGELADLLGSEGAWRRIHGRFDGYEGWIHAGYVRSLPAEAALQWDAAAGWSDGAWLRLDGERRAVPLRARVVVRPEGDGITLPDGRVGVLAGGKVWSSAEAVRIARAEPLTEWLRARFAGTPYLWGGVTPSGVDCSGLVQTAFAARGVPLPRDAAQQAALGAAIDPAGRQPGDLLFFRGEETDRITHVAVEGPEGALCHSAISRGGFTIEPTTSGTPGAELLARLVAVRRLPHAGT